MKKISIKISDEIYNTLIQKASKLGIEVDKLINILLAKGVLK